MSYYSPWINKPHYKTGQNGHYAGKRKLFSDMVNQMCTAVYISNFQESLQHCRLHTHHYGEAKIQQRPCSNGTKKEYPSNGR